MHQFDSGRGLKDMRKITKTSIISVVFASIVFFATTVNVFAQDLSYNKAYQDYQYNLTQYNEAFSNFKYAKNTYTANPTLNLKEEVRSKMFTMLTARDQLLSVYLGALKAKISEDTGLTKEDKESIISKIDLDINWHEEDKAKYLATDSLEVLLGKSEEGKKRYEEITSITISKALIYITLGQEISLRLKHEQILSGLKSLIDSGVASGKLTASPFTHWFEDIETTTQTLKQNEEKLRQEIAKIDERTYYTRDVCDNCNQILSSSVLSLSQLNQFLTEVLNYIDNND